MSRMKGALLIVTVRNVQGHVLAEVERYLFGNPSVHKPRRDDEEFLHEVWQEVGDDLRGAMRRYPLEEAAADQALAPASS